MQHEKLVSAPAFDLAVTSPESDTQFRRLARSMGLIPEDKWVGGYVQYEWEHARHIFASYGISLAGKRVLEFGCNLGATSIVMAALGAEVVGVDVDASMVRLAQANADRYGVAPQIRFMQLNDTTQLPFPDQYFDLVTCNSVLEYVSAQQLASVQKTLDRVLRAGGVLLVTGTSNRLWPREVHSRGWRGNYCPAWLDQWFSPQRPPQRGVFPWTIRFGFGRYQNLDWQDRAHAYLMARRRMGMNSGSYRLLQLAAPLLHLIGLTPGLLTPSISIALRKPPAHS